MTQLLNSNSAYLPEKEGYTPLADITPAEIGQYGAEQGWSPQKMAEAVKAATQARIDRAETKYKDDPQKYASEYRIIQEQTPKAMQILALEEAKQRALAVNLGDRESANDMLTLMTKPPVQLVDGGQSPIQPDQQATHVDEIYGSDYVNAAFKDPAFQLNEKKLIDDRTIEDGKGNSYGNMEVIKGKDGKRTALVTLNKVTGKSAGEKAVDVLAGVATMQPLLVPSNSFDGKNDQAMESSDVRKYRYAIPTDEEVVKHIEDTKKALAIANKKVEDINSQNKFALEHPDAYGEAGPAINITMSADRQVKAAKEKARLESELSFLERASMPQAKEYLGEKRLNSIIVNDPKTGAFTNDLNILGDVLDGALRFRAATANALSNGSADAENDLNTINKDGTGSTLIGEAPDSLKSLASQAAQSVGFQLIPFVAGAGLGYAASSPVLNTAAVLGGMGVGSYGAQLAQTDNMIESAAETIKNKYKKNPFDATIKEDEAELVRLKENREVNALGHAIVETATETLGGYGGLILPKIKNKFLNLALDVGSELVEEKIAEPANQLIDYMTYGERLTPEQASDYSIYMTTLMSLPPLLFGGHLIGGAIQSKQDKLKAASAPTATTTVPAGTVMPPTPNTLASPNTLSNPNAPAVNKPDYNATVDALIQPVSPEARQAAAKEGAAALTNILPAVTQANEQLEQTTAAANKATAEIVTAPNSVANPKPTTKPDGTPIEPTTVNPDQIIPDSQSTEKPVPDNHVRIPASKSSLIPVTPPETAPASGEAKPKAPEPTHVDIPKPVMDYGVEIFPTFKDFASWSKGMATKFGEGIKEHLQSLWDWILSSFKSAHNAISDAITYTQVNARGINLKYKDAGDVRRLNELVKSPTPEGLDYFRKKYPGIYNESLQALMAETNSGSSIDSIRIQDLAKLYAHIEPGFEKGGVVIVDEGTYTAGLENRPATGAFVTPKGNQATYHGGVPKAPVLTANEQQVLAGLYHSKIISEDQLSKAINSIFRAKNFLSLYARTKGANVRHLNNSADSTITNVEKRQSKIKEADSVGAIMDPANPDHTDNTPIVKSFVQASDHPLDVFTHLGINFMTQDVLDEKTGELMHTAIILTQKEKTKLYKFYDEQFGVNNWILKEGEGAAGLGFHSAESLKAKKKQRYQHFFPAVVQEKMKIDQEYRVNVYLDSKGKARAIPHAISVKKTNAETGQTPHYAPYKVTTNFTNEMSVFAENALSESASKKQDQSTGRGAVYGVDVAVVTNKKGQKEYKIIEFNSPDPYYDKYNIGGTSGTFSRHGGFPIMNLSSFLQGKVPADIALVNAMATMIKNGSLTVDGKSLVPSHVTQTNRVAQETKDSQSNENPNSRMNSGIDPTRIVNDIKTIYKGTKDFMSWSGKMIKKFGEKIRPLLNAIFSQLKQFAGEITEDFLHKIGVLQYAQNPKAKTPVSNAKQNATKDYNPDNYIRLDGNIKVDKSYLDPANLAKAEKIAAIIAKKNKGVNAGIMSHADIMTNIAEIKANEEDNKFIQLKKENLSAFYDYNNDRTFKSDPNKKLSYKEAKQILLDQLDQLEASDPIDDKKARPDSEARRSAIKSLKRNLGIAEKYKQSDEFKNLPENIKRFLIMGIAGINESITDESSTNNIKRAAIALASLTDDGSPVGMFKFAYEKFHVENIDKIKAIEATAGKPLHTLLSDPISWVRRMEFFGDKTGTGASVASVPVEVSKMSGGFDQVEQWLQNLYSIFVANLDHQSAEYSYERELFNEYVNSLFPRGIIVNSLAGTQSSISVEEQVRVGIASILTQYEVNSLNPLEELERASENVFNGINFRKNVPHEGWNAALDEKAFNALMQGIDYKSMTADQVIKAIEANMTSPERSVLYYARSKSAQYLPSLRVVAGISGNRLLSEYTNYVKTSQRKGPTEERPMGGALAFDNMQSVVMERKGLSHDGTTPNSRVNGYYETSILQLMNTFLDEASYEKHTGVERTMIRQLLNDNRFTDNLEEPNQRVNKPRTERLKSMLGNYHSSRIGNTNHFGRLTGLYLTLSSLLKGSILISLPMFMGNTASAIINSLALASFPARGMRMLTTVMSEYASSGQIRRDSDKWLADNFPSQLRRSRTEEISLALRPGPNKGLERAQKELAVGRNQLKTYLENGLQIAFGAFADKLAGGIVNRLSHLSAASAETMASKLGVWASYISQLNEKGHSYDTLEEFLLNPVVDNEAMTSAMFTIDKMTGIASMKESQGGFYHLDTKVKVIANDTLMLFGRQTTQMGIQAGTELSQIAARGLTPTQRAKHLARAANIITSVLAYSFAKHQLKALLYGGTVLAIPFVSQFISNEDDEKKKKAIRDELLKIKLNEERKTHFNYVTDIANTITGNIVPVLNTTYGRDKISARLFDNLVSKEEDKLLDNSIVEAQKELDSMKVLFNSDLKTKGIDGVSKLSSTIMAQEDKIETMKNLKGIRVEAYGERFADQFVGVLGAKVIDIGKHIIDWVSTSKTEEQLRLEDTEESMTMIGGKLMSAVDAVALQSGFKQAYKASVRKLAQDKIKQENADAKATELMDRRMKNKTGKNE